MHRKLLTAVVTAVVLGGFAAPRAAHAITQITNTATVNYNNGSGIPQAAAVGSTTYAAQSDPVLTVTKVSVSSTYSMNSGPSGTTVYWDISVVYKRVVDPYLVCGDDSTATGVVLKDPIPAGFNYIPSTIQVSTNAGASFTAYPDNGANTDYNVTTAGAVTVKVTNITGAIVEGTGDNGNCPAAPQEIVVRFGAVKI